MPSASPEQTPTPWLVALDIDGTLLDFGSPISPVVLEAVREVAAAGHRVILASGRSLVSMALVARQLGVAAPYMVCSNGAVLVHAAALEPGGPTPAAHLGGHDDWVVSEAITFDPGPALRQLAAHLPNATFAVEDVGVGFRMTGPFPPGELEGVHTVVPLEELWGHEVTRVVVRAVDLANDDFVASIRDLGLADVTYAVGWSSWMDVAPLGVTKALGLEKVRGRLGIPAERTLAVGDGYNDLEMIRWAARGVAMGNAEPEVKEAADEIAPSVHDDGLAAVLRTLPL